jgi:hypothetical protein
MSLKMAVCWVVEPCSLHGATTQKTAIFVLTAVRTSYLTKMSLPSSYFVLAQVIHGQWGGLRRSILFGRFQTSTFAFGRRTEMRVRASLSKFVWAKFRNTIVRKARTDCVCFKHATDALHFCDNYNIKFCTYFFRVHSVSSAWFRKKKCSSYVRTQYM